MEDPKIKKSIREQLQRGLTAGAVKSNLVMEGYQEADIDDAFNNLDSPDPEPVVEPEPTKSVEPQKEVSKAPQTDGQEDILGPISLSNTSQSEKVTAGPIIENIQTNMPVELEVEKTPVAKLASEGEDELVEVRKKTNSLIPKKLQNKFDRLPDEVKKKLSFIVAVNVTVLIMFGVIWLWTLYS